MADTLTTMPAIFGEVLFDVFPDGNAVMGGAPFNVAWHLQGFGLSPLMITAVGDDENGQSVLSAMQSWGMDSSGVQIDKAHPTGQVAVTLQGSIPTYEIVVDQAYDFIDLEKSRLALTQHKANFLYHGSLAVRTEAAQTTLDGLLKQNNIDTFVDVNLRKPWWSQDSIKNMLSKARWVKLNDEELAIIMGLTVDQINDFQALAMQCLTQYSLQRLIVTLGDKGAFCVTADEIVNGEPVKAKNIIDTVGAGDSFSAVMILGLIKEWPLATALSRALQFASAICELRGATTTDRRLYDGFLDQW